MSDNDPNKPIGKISVNPLDPFGVAEGVGDDIREGVDTVTAPITSLNDLAQKISSPGFWKRILTGVAGVWLIYIGILIIIASTPLGKSVAGVAVTGASRGVVNGGAVVDAVSSDKKED